MGRRSFPSIVLSLFTVGLLLWSSHAFADELVIKRPGAHPQYAFEAEPHLLFDPLDVPGPGGDDGFGVGFRGTIPIIENGFVPKINNSVGIGFGADWITYRRFSNCNGNAFACEDGRFARIYLPVVMQWNFFLSRNWSVFGEPGGAFRLTDDDLDLDPFVFYLGGRWHFSQAATLTMRFGYPTFSLGVSFLL